MISKEYIRLNNLIEQIDFVLSSDFPYRAPKEALIILKNEALNRVEDIKNVCSYSELEDDIKIEIGEFIKEVTEYTGFLLRSTHVRNPIESYLGISKIAKDILGQDVNVVLSSEWRASPFHKPAKLDSLKRFVFIGMPVTESQNALLLPLSGHEIGHVIWNEMENNKKLNNLKKNIKICINKREEDNLLTHLKVEYIERCVYSRCKEVFCDFIGYRIFNIAFWHSFIYYTSTSSLLNSYSDIYPSFLKRLEYLKLYLSHIGDENINHIETHLYYEKKKNQEESPWKTVFYKFLDEILDEVVQDIIKVANKQKIHNYYNKQNIKKIKEWISRTMSPPNHEYNIVDIVNAGWEVFNDVDIMWNEYFQDDDYLEKYKTLNNILLKTMEVSDFIGLVETGGQQRMG